MPLPSSTRGPLPYLVILVLGWLALAPGILSLPPVDRDESRYAQAAKQMLETGDFVRIRFQEEPRHKKPVGIYWLEAASVWATGLFPGAAIWPYRLPSLLGALAALMLTYTAGSRLFEPRSALLATGFLGASVLFAVVARQAHTDACLLATAVASQGALGRIYLEARRGAPRRLGPVLMFWAAEGVAILIKGPVIPAVSLLTLLALAVTDRDWGLWRRLRPIIGVPLAAAIAAPWFIAVSFATDGGFIADAVTTDLLPKLVSGQEGHGAPPGYYLVLMMLAFWPASLFAWPALIHAWQRRLEPSVRFCLAWLIPAWVMFELVPTKLPSYVLPTYPALALLSADLVQRAAAGALTPLEHRWPRAIGTLWLVISLAIAAAPLGLAMLLHSTVGAAVIVLALLATALAGAVATLAYRKRWRMASAIALLGAAMILAGTFGHVLPRLDGLWVSRAAAESVARHNRSAEGAAAIASVGYTEPSLVFLVGTRLKFLDAEAAARHLAAANDHLALVRDREDGAFRRAIDAAGTPYRVLDSLEGFNYSRGEWISLRLYGQAP